MYVIVINYNDFIIVFEKRYSKRLYCYGEKIFYVVLLNVDVILID